MVFFKCKALRSETSDGFIKKKAEDCKTEERERERATAEWLQDQL